jgi:hypothetical protein
VIFLLGSTTDFNTDGGLSFRIARGLLAYVCDGVLSCVVSLTTKQHVVDVVYVYGTVVHAKLYEYGVRVGG